MRPTVAPQRDVLARHAGMAIVLVRGVGMSRSRSSAKQAGTEFEKDFAEFAARRLGDDRIERRARNGKNDRGDITGIRTVTGERVVVECKDVAKLSLGTWVREAEVEKGNDDATVAVVAHKRRGYGPKKFGGTYITMTAEDLMILLGADPEDPNEGETQHGES
jgi:hypothetical protein